MVAVRRHTVTGRIIVLGRDPDDAEVWISSWTAQSTGRAEAATRLADRVAGVTAEASGVDGAVRVSVARTGDLVGFRLDRRVRDRAPDHHAQANISTMRRAQASHVPQVTAAVADTVGAETESGRVVLAGYARRFPAEPGE
jgi:hypothetical protein